MALIGAKDVLAHEDLANERRAHEFIQPPFTRTNLGYKLRYY